jgi:hypothetical protein
MKGQFNGLLLKAGWSNRRDLPHWREKYKNSRLIDSIDLKGITPDI